MGFNLGHYLLVLTKEDKEGEKILVLSYTVAICGLCAMARATGDRGTPQILLGSQEALPHIQETAAPIFGREVIFLISSSSESPIIPSPQFAVIEYRKTDVFTTVWTGDKKKANDPNEKIESDY